MKWEDMDFRYLEAFFEVARELSFKRAAQKLAISPSAVTRQIKLLEQSMKKRLFIRSPKKVLLTEEGLDLLKKTESFVDELGFLPPQKIRLGTLQSILEEKLLEALAKKTKKWKKSIGEIYIGTPKNLEEKLLNGQLDIIITNKKMQNQLVSMTNWSNETYKIISKEKIHEKKLKDYDWVYSPVFEKAFSSLKIPLDKVIKVNSFNACVRLAIKGAGLTIVPLKMKVPNTMYELPLTSKSIIDQIYLITHRNEFPSDHFKAIWDILFEK